VDGSVRKRPGRFVQLMMKFIILITSTYWPFLLQCASNKADYCLEISRAIEEFDLKLLMRIAIESDLKPLAEVASWRRLATIYKRIMTFTFPYVVVKYSLILLIRWFGLSFGSLGYFDCFMVGRFKFLGRASRVGEFLLIIFAIIYCTYLFILLELVPGFKFYASEFMLHDPDSVESFSEYVKSADKQHQHHHHHSCGPPIIIVRDGAGPSSGAAPAVAANKRQPQVDMNCKTPKIDSLFYLKNRLNANVDREWIRRPNRTVASWLSLNHNIRIIVTAGIIVALLFIGVVSYLLAGSVLSDIGFESSYPACASWIRDKQTNGSREFSSIYVAPRLLAHEMEIKDLPPIIPFELVNKRQMTWYKAIIVICDTFENVYLYGLFTLNLMFVYCLVALYALDIIKNSTAIRLRLVALMRSMANKRRQADPDADHQPIQSDGDAYGGGDGPFDHDPGHHEESIRCQALVVDHLEQTIAYNKFASFFFSVLFAMWLGYTLLIYLWLGSASNKELEYEFLIVQLLATSFMITLLSIGATVSTHNGKLYIAIARLMASTDALERDTKLRWASLMDFFSPKPLHCLTLLGSVKISWLLSLKVSLLDGWRFTRLPGERESLRHFATRFSR
jgi:hypothetical protein